MATDLERLSVVLEARFDKYNRDLQQGLANTNRQLGAIERRFATFGASLKASTSSAAIGIGGMLGGLGAYLGVQQLKEYADGWLTITRTIAGGEQVFGMRLRSAEELNKLANESRVDNEAYAKLYVRTAAATRELGAAEEEVARTTTTVAQALKLGTATASEQASVMLQLSQALTKGKLDGDEFRSVMENASVIQELLADRLKVSRGEIIRMAADGKISVQALFGALLEGGEKVERIFKGLPSTIEEAMTVLRNSLEQYVGKLDKANGITPAFIDGLASISRNMETVGDAALVMGAALLATFGGGALGGLIRFASLFATLPGLIAGGAVAIDQFGERALFDFDALFAAFDRGAGSAGALNAAMMDLGNTGTTIQDQFRGLISVIGQDLMGWVSDISVALTGQTISWETLSAGAIFAIGSIVAGFKGLMTLISAAPSVLANHVSAAFVGAINAIAGALQTMIDAFAEGVNQVIALANKLPGVEMGFLVAPQVGTMENSALGRLKAQSKQITDQLEKDFDIRGFMGRVDSAAKDRAFERQKAGWNPLTPLEAKPNYPTPPAADKAGAKRRASFERDLLELENRIALEKVETQTIGASAFQVEKMRAEQQLLNEARKAGIALTDADKLKVTALATEYANVVTQNDMLREAFEDIKSTSEDALKGFITDLREGATASEALGNSLNRIADKLIDFAVNKLVENALGGLTGNTASPGGPNILSLFGFAKGGVMTGQGPRALPRFAKGGVSRQAAIFGEAGPEAAVPLPDGRRIPVDLRTPDLANVRPQAGAGGSVMVRVEAGPELMVTIDNRARGIVAQAAPLLTGTAVREVDRRLPSMITKAQKRGL